MSATSSDTTGVANRSAEKTEPEDSGEAAGLADHIKTFLEENGRSTSMEITGEMAGLGYDQNAARDALQELKRRGEVRQLKDADGNPINKYERHHEPHPVNEVSRETAEEAESVLLKEARELPDSDEKKGELQTLAAGFANIANGKEGYSPSQGFKVVRDED